MNEINQPKKRTLFIYNRSKRSLRSRVHQKQQPGLSCLSPTPVVDELIDFTVLAHRVATVGSAPRGGLAAAAAAWRWEGVGVYAVGGTNHVLMVGRLSVGKTLVCEEA